MQMLILMFLLFFVIEILFALKNLMTKEEFPKEYLAKYYGRKLLNRLALYGFALMAYVLTYLYVPVYLIVLLGVVGLVYVFPKTREINQVDAGYNLLKGKSLEVGGLIVVDGKQEGEVKEFGLVDMSLKTNQETEIIFPYKHIQTIEKIGEYRLLKETLVLNFREDPKKAIEKMETAVSLMNEEFKEELKEGGQFRVNGIVSTNSGYHGMLYEIEGTVKTLAAQNIARRIRFILADTAYESNLKMAETNVYYRTRMSSK